MESQKIKLELEVPPEIAFFLCMYLIATPQGNLTFQNALTETGIKQLADIAQSIMAAGNPCKVLRSITEEDKHFYFKKLRFEKESSL